MNSSTPAPGVQNTPEAVPCYNCGANGHFFNACPEPARKLPFGLAAAQAKGMAGGHAQNGNAFKRQKTGNGPVVTRYPVPGPVVTKYGPPPQGMPFHGTYGPQAQFAAQYPPQTLAQAQNFQPPQATYPPQGYASQPQYGQYPAAVSPAQPMPYGIGAHAQNVPLQYQYGYDATPPYYQQQSQLVGGGYSAPQQYAPQQYAHQQYVPSVPAHHQQQNAAYFQPPAAYPPPQHYPMQTYQPGYLGVAPAHGTSGAFVQPQQYGPGGQPQYPYQPTPVVPHAYPGYHGQSFAPQMQQYSHQSPQQWQPGHTPTLATQGLNSATGNPVNTNFPTRAASVSGSIEAHDIIPGATGSNARAKRSLRGRGSQEPAGDGSTTENNVGPVRPPFRATPIIDPFDLAWEDSIKDFTYTLSVQAVPISTPITLKHEEFPALWTSASTKVRSKYIEPENLDDFILPIENSVHWSALKDDPAFAEIDESLPNIAEADWIEYQQARRAHLASLENTPSPEMTRRSIETAHSREPHHNDEYRAADAGDTQSHVNSYDQGHPVSAPRYSNSRSRSRTPSLRDRGLYYEADGGDDTWAPRSSVSRQATPLLGDEKEALLASFGASRPSKPAIEGNISITGQPRNMRTTPGAPSRQDSGYISGRPSMSSGPDYGVNKGDGNRGNPWSAQNPPPPPPPPPRGARGHGSRGQSPTYGSNHSRGSSRNQSRSASTTRTPDESPLSPTSAALLGHIPMEGETNGRKRKQVDDHYVKRKPQPRVNEAFSRRW